MRIKAGKYTLAITMIVCGILMLLNTIYGNYPFMGLWMYSPVVLILFGLEVIVLNLVYANREDCKIHVSIGSLFLILIVLIIFTVWTNKVEIVGLGDFINFNLN